VDTKLEIDASPTKEFFISMLVKDIDLIDAIADLVDNSVDGARGLKTDNIFDGLYVNIEVSSGSFKITDNCGGFSIDVARKYAFKFGRPVEAGMLNHSIGRFGVGMKRAIFKIGKKFRIESRTQDSYFLLEDDVDSWKSKPDDWTFRFAKVEQDPTKLPSGDCGTSISINALYQPVAQDFTASSSNFLIRLSEDLSNAHRAAIIQGLRITLNGQILVAAPLFLLQSEDLMPAYKELLFDADDGKVKIKIYSGIATAEPSAAGWYVFCNDRAILKADQTGTTGWGEGSERANPQYHNQFARYRGYVFFDAENPGALPWTTTKKNVDSDSSVYRAARLQMALMMRPVINFLNKVATERTGGLDADDQFLEQSIKNAKLAAIEDVVHSPDFKFPTAVIQPRLAETGRIQYSKPNAEIAQVKKRLKVSTLKDVGEKTFEYYLEMECD
jgi:hypothetical protein